MENFLFDDIMTENNLFQEFDQQSQSSLLDVMVDAMMDPIKEELPAIAQLDNLKSLEPHKHDHIQAHESIDQGLFCLDPHVKEPVEDLMVRDSSKATSSTAKVTPEMKIFKISNCPQKNGGQLSSQSKVDTNKEAMPIKDDHTEIDSNEVVIAVPEPKSVKRPRRDVTYKTILRKCRKYYQTRFNHHTGYLKNKKKEPCSFYRACILKFIDSYFEYNTHLNVSFHLGCLLYPQEMTRGIESFVYPDGVKTFTPKKVVKRKIETHKQQVDKLHSILYKFTHEKLDKFISVPELAAIFVNFIQNGAGKDVASQEFKAEYDDLLKRCLKTLSKCKKVKGVATLFD
ncbi:unnamed protein product [Moneuplotes crassus]|uniref:Uncharacterized protein n=1 Tax=Euplotes crassus TaxID=5936 RepID=A0AAD1U5F4_EUPCR|nr:unnamed protein product [Moneuplotes crassus]